MLLNGCGEMPNICTRSNYFGYNNSDHFLQAVVLLLPIISNSKFPILTVHVFVSRFHVVGWLSLPDETLEFKICATRDETDIATSLLI